MTLVILAAGRSTRFGRLKQLAPVGPGGEALLDYAIHDAALAGFSRVVLVIQEGLQAAFEEHFGVEKPDSAERPPGDGRHRRHVDADLPKPGRSHRPNVGIARRPEIRYVHQPLAHPDLIRDPPPGRTRPWGTGFAVIAAAAGIGGEPIDGPFAVCNADDFYGRGAYRAVAATLREQARAEGGTARACTVGYPVGATLSSVGGVSRGICTVDARGALLQLTEGLNLGRDGDRVSGHDPAGRPVTVALDAPVCTNLWGFQPDILPLLRERFAAFLAAGPGRDREFYLSEAINDLIALGRIRCTVLPTRERWLGVTFPEDHAGVAAALSRMVESGVYQPTQTPDRAPCNSSPSTGSSSRFTG